MCRSVYGGRGGWLCLVDVLDVPDVTRRVLLCMLEAVEVGFCFAGGVGGAGGGGGDAPCAALYAGSRGGQALFARTRGGWRYGTL